MSECGKLVHAVHRKLTLAVGFVLAIASVGLAPHSHPQISSKLNWQCPLFLPDPDAGS